MAKKYDFNKVRQILGQYDPKDISSASLGMGEDWHWTAESIWEDGKCTLPDTDTGDIAGIEGSPWATPTLKIEFSNDEEKTFNCYQTDDVNVSAEEITAMKTFAKATGGMDSVK